LQTARFVGAAFRYAAALSPRTFAIRLGLLPALPASLLLALAEWNVPSGRLGVDCPGWLYLLAAYGETFRNALAWKEARGGKCQPGEGRRWSPMPSADGFAFLLIAWVCALQPDRTGAGWIRRALNPLRYFGNLAAKRPLWPGPLLAAGVPY
jgi:hypothetical protein